MKNFLVLLVIGAMSVTGCSKKEQQKTEETTLPTAANADENLNGDSDSGKAMGLQTIHFAYDNSTLDSEAKGILKTNGQIMKDKGSMKIQVEGHCDARGGIQYNLGLGEKRANSVKKFLVDQGIQSDRVMTISFGKEKLLDNAETEAANAKNRRANFVITSR